MNKIKKITKSKAFHICIIIVIITVILFIAGMLMLKYDVEGETNMPFKLSKIAVISAQEGIDTGETDTKWSFNVNQGNDIYIYIDKNENYVRPENANRRLRELMEKMNISSISSHSLRHTYGTRCVEAGMRAVALQRLMGHSDVAITLNTYTSVFNKYKEAELEKVNNYYMNNEIVSADNLLAENNNLIESISNEREEKEIE